MKCPKCGYEQAIYDDINEWWHCPQCHGSGEVPLTEQEYLQTCNTEQLAEALLNIMANNEFTLYLLHTEKKSVQEIKGAVVEWLKQPHTTIKE